jgi:hypothetical protein
MQVSMDSPGHAGQAKREAPEQAGRAVRRLGRSRRPGHRQLVPLPVSNHPGGRHQRVSSMARAPYPARPEPEPACVEVA